MVLDIILAILIVLLAIIGYKKGFIKMLADFAGKLVALVIAYFYYKPFKLILVKFTGIDEFFYDKVKVLLSALGGKASETSITSNDMQAISKTNIPEFIKDKLIEHLTNAGSELGKSVVYTISNFLTNIVSIFILFLLILILIKIIAKVLDLAAKLPVINTFNKLGGVIFSLLANYIVLTIVFLLVTSFISISLSGTINTVIDSSFIAKGLIKYNPLLILLANMHL